MPIRVFGSDNKPFNMQEYKKEILANQKGLCAVTQDLGDINQGDVMMHNGKEWFVSHIGMKTLRDYFGTVYIDSKIVHGAKQKSNKFERMMSGDD